MTLTVVIRSSGSGKTTFLNDTYASHQCTYVRQFHHVRPFVTVAKIPNFDPTQLPYWDIYVRELKAARIKVGGTLAGEFTAGLSGGQRKLLLFELICQRTLKKDNDGNDKSKASGSSPLLLVLDEPFAGVTDDFVPYIVQQLALLSKQDNVLLVTNDHIAVLSDLANNTIVVSAVDRTTVTVNDTELLNDSVITVVAFTILAFGLLLASFWDSSHDNGALIMVGGTVVSFFSVYPYLITLPDWRIYMVEEAKALLHASPQMNKICKAVLTTILIVLVSLVDWIVVNAVVDGFESPKFWIAILTDSASMTALFFLFGLLTNMSFHDVELFGLFPFILAIFWSGTFAPGAGVPGLEELRYLFPRFYLWCLMDVVKDEMDCPAGNDNDYVLYMIASALVPLALFVLYKVVAYLASTSAKNKQQAARDALKDDEFERIQTVLFGEKKQRDTMPDRESVDNEFIDERVPKAVSADSEDEA